MSARARAGIARVRRLVEEGVLSVPAGGRATPDKRFTVALLDDVAAVLTAHGYELRDHAALLTATLELVTAVERARTEGPARG